MKKIIFIVLLSLILPLVAQAAADGPPAEVALTRSGYFNDLAGISLHSKSLDTLEDILKKYHQQSGNELVIVAGRLPFGATAKDLAVRALKEWGIKRDVVLAVAIVPDSNATYTSYFHNEAFILASDDLKDKLSKGEAAAIVKKIVLPWLNSNEPFMAFFNGAHEIIQLISAREKKPFDLTQVWGLSKYDIENLISLKMGFLDRLINILEWAAAVVVLIIIGAYTKRKSLFKK